MANHLHLLCDLQEPSLSCAVREARRRDKYELRIAQIRGATFAASMDQLAGTMGVDDAALVALLHAPDDQLKAAAKVLARHTEDVRSRITLCCSKYSWGMEAWAKARKINYQTNAYESPRRPPFASADPTHGTTLAERQWIQYRLMRALIAGEAPAAVFEEIIRKLRKGSLSPTDAKRAQRFVEQGEPDMAGGNFAGERQANPNAIDRLRNRAVQVGRSGLNTLIIGETGTGKESLAWYLHDFSTRCDQPFMALNCAFFEGERLESELFGHEKGSFTGADRTKKGLVEVAAGGTLFLDELPEMAPRVQAKLLRFLQDGSYSRLGGDKPMRADVRIICAAQPDLLEDQDKLRRDLYYRVADVELRTVPLREMLPRDAVNIACNLAYRLMWRPVTREDGEGVLTPDTIRATWQQLARPEHVACLAGYSWPGNMRELSAMINRLVLLGDDIFGELRDKSTGTRVVGIDVSDDEWRRFLLPVSSMKDIEERQLKIENLKGAYLRHLVASLGGSEKIQPTKLAKILGCAYNTLIGCIGKH